MLRKGFPESYDAAGAGVPHRRQIRQGARHRAGLSHLSYDIVPGECSGGGAAGHLDLRGSQRAAGAPGAAGTSLGSPTSSTSRSTSTPRGRHRAVVCRPVPCPAGNGVRRPALVFHESSALTDAEALATARRIWREVNFVNLHGHRAHPRTRAPHSAQGPRSMRSRVCGCASCELFLIATITMARWREGHRERECRRRNRVLIAPSRLRVLAIVSVCQPSPCIWNVPDQMVVHHPRRLHEGVADRGPDELEPASS